ncbi:ketol-acid reductoisomerase, partial [Pasteurella multocida subsp. multocida str. Anand1_cattle]
FNTLNLRQQLDQLGRCRFMDRNEFANEADYLKGKNCHRRLRGTRLESGFEHA